MRARELTADGAAGPSALRLDQLPAEVRAEELAPCLSPQGPRRSVRRGLAAPSHVCCSASAGPAGVRGAPCTPPRWPTWRLETSFLAADSLQARTAPFNIGSSHKPAAAMLGTRCAWQAVQGGARAAVLERAGVAARCQAVAGARTARYAPSNATTVAIRFGLLLVHKAWRGHLRLPLN